MAKTKEHGRASGYSTKAEPCSFHNGALVGGHQELGRLFAGRGPSGEQCIWNRGLNRETRGVGEEGGRGGERRRGIHREGRAFAYFMPQRAQSP